MDNKENQQTKTNLVNEATKSEETWSDEEITRKRNKCQKIGTSNPEQTCEITSGKTTEMKTDNNDNNNGEEEDTEPIPNSEGGSVSLAYLTSNAATAAAHSAYAASAAAYAATSAVAAAAYAVDVAYAAANVASHAAANVASHAAASANAAAEAAAIAAANAAANDRLQFVTVIPRRRSRRGNPREASSSRPAPRRAD